MCVKVPDDRESRIGFVQGHYERLGEALGRRGIQGHELASALIAYLCQIVSSDEVLEDE